MSRAHREASTIGRIGAGIVCLCFCAHPALGQADGSYEPERTSWGTPDITGIWDFRTLTPLERPPELADKAVLTAEEALAFREQALELLDVDNRENPSEIDVEGAYNRFWWDWGSDLTEDRRTSLIVDPPDGRIPPLTPEARARLLEQNRYRTPPVRDLFSYSAGVHDFLPAGPESLGLSERCLQGFNAGPPMRPSAYNNNVRIVQTPDYVVLVTEMIHDARIIPMDGRPRLPPELKFWSGDSRGHWEGDTLVIETTNFTDKISTFQLPVTLQNLTEGGAVGSGGTLHLTERLTPIAEGRLLYEFTIDDPATFTRPFTVAIPMKATAGPIFEYACHEGNYAMPSMLKAARLQEREAQGSSPESGDSP